MGITSQIDRNYPRDKSLGPSVGACLNWLSIGLNKWGTILFGFFGKGVREDWHKFFLPLLNLSLFFSFYFTFMHRCVPIPDYLIFLNMVSLWSIRTCSVDQTDYEHTDIYLSFCLLSGGNKGMSHQTLLNLVNFRHIVLVWNFYLN